MPIDSRGNYEDSYGREDRLSEERDAALNGARDFADLYDKDYEASEEARINYSDKLKEVLKIIEEGIAISQRLQELKREYEAVKGLTGAEDIAKQIEALQRREEELRNLMEKIEAELQSLKEKWLALKGNRDGTLSVALSKIKKVKKIDKELGN